MLETLPSSTPRRTLLTSQPVYGVSMTPANGGRMTDTFYNALENALMQRQGERHGPEIRFLCPAHDDHNPSADYHTVKHSWICRSCGAKGGAFELADLVNVPRPVRSSGSAIQETYSYTDEQGKELFQVVRLLENGKKTFRQRHYNPQHPKAKPDGYAWTLEGVRRVLHGLPAVLEAVKQGNTVFIVEGEKDAATLEEWGFTATCNPAGAGKWRPEYSESLRGADVVILPDNDSAGREHAAQVKKSLEGIAKTIKVLELPNLPEKGDVSDWKANGGTLEAFKVLLETPPQESAPKPSQALKTETIAALLEREFPERKDLLKGLIPETGLVVLAGAHKLGKSWFALQLSLAVAHGGRFLNEDIEAGDVLYLALEDNPRRMQNRVNLLLQHDDFNAEALERFHYIHEIEPLDLGGLEHIRAWLETHPNAKIVVVDVLKRALSGRLDFNDYGAVTAALGPLQRLAGECGVVILAVTHTRKGLSDGGDPFDRVLGSTAIASVADATLILARDRMQNAATLAVTGRDIEERELAIQRDPDTALWSLNGDGNPKTVALTPLHTQMLEAITDGVNTNKALCDLLGKRKAHVSNLLRRLTERGHIEQQAGVYIPRVHKEVHNSSQPGSQPCELDKEASDTAENTSSTQGTQGTQHTEHSEQSELFESEATQSLVNPVNCCELPENMRAAQHLVGTQGVVNSVVNPVNSVVNSAIAVKRTYDSGDT